MILSQISWGVIGDLVDVEGPGCSAAASVPTAVASEELDSAMVLFKANYGKSTYVTWFTRRFFRTLDVESQELKISCCNIKQKWQDRDVSQYGQKFLKCLKVSWKNVFSYSFVNFWAKFPENWTFLAQFSEIRKFPENLISDKNQYKCKSVSVGNVLSVGKWTNE